MQHGSGQQRQVPAKSAWLLKLTGVDFVLKSPTACPHHFHFKINKRPASWWGCWLGLGHGLGLTLMSCSCTQISIKLARLVSSRTRRRFMLRFKLLMKWNLNFVSFLCENARKLFPYLPSLPFPLSFFCSRLLWRVFSWLSSAGAGIAAAVVVVGPP